MKRARSYLKELKTALNSWTRWTEKGEQYLRGGKADFLDEWITYQYSALRDLDAEDVKDAVCAHADNIEFNLNQLYEYGLMDIVRYYVDVQDKRANLSDAGLGEKIDDYLRLVGRKINDLLRVHDECERYIRFTDPMIEKALGNKLLLAYFRMNRKELASYINYCEKCNTPTEMAKMAAMMEREGKIDYTNINKNLHDELGKIGLPVGNYENWRKATRKITKP